MKKRYIIIIILLILAVGGGGAYLWRMKQNEKQPVASAAATVTPSASATATPSPSPSPTASVAEGLSQNEINAMKSEADSFYQAAYSKDYDTVVSLMTDNFAKSFNGLRNSNDQGANDYGADVVLNLSSYTDVSTPASTGDPEVIAENAEYAVVLTLKGDYVAKVSFQKMANGDYKVFAFNAQSASKGNGGTAGSGGKGN